MSFIVDLGEYQFVIFLIFDHTYTYCSFSYISAGTLYCALGTLGVVLTATALALFILHLLCEFSYES